MKKMTEKLSNREDTAEIPVGFPDKRNFPSGKTAEKYTHRTEDGFLKPGRSVYQQDHHRHFHEWPDDGGKGHHRMDAKHSRG